MASRAVAWLLATVAFALVAAPCRAQGWHSVASQHTPAARMGHSMVNSEHQIFLFGGLTSEGLTNDVWRYNSKGWTLVNSGRDNSPSPRFQASIAWVPGGFVIFGGAASWPVAEGRLFGDLWHYSIRRNHWSQLSFAYDGPGMRLGMALSACKGGVVAFGGQQLGLRNDAWMFDLHTHQWNLLVSGGSPGSPSPRGGAKCRPYGPLMPWRNATATVACYGGWGDNFDPLNDLWLLDVANGSWRRVPAHNAPPPLIGSAFSVNGTRVMYSFGGGLMRGKVAASNQLYIYVQGRPGWQEAPPSSSPSARWFTSSVVLGNALYVFGGSSGNIDDPGALLQDTWRWTN